MGPCYRSKAKAGYDRLKRFSFILGSDLHENSTEETAEPREDDIQLLDLLQQLGLCGLPAGQDHQPDHHQLQEVGGISEKARLILNSGT